ncbi:putative inactive cadmium/zinc-transporting ATPase HMA3 [Mangifera indica]|uniref:putative inactive cadmium/zinc-transporting ATPase HMA3 n=1 Tax=Mangifera indica TaxID=29780 RepID=UPI001CFA1B6B|nr:putative inactive cadmium/zinc-transporting ATPase HMA3 [Mangifera indica]XP_044471995.1 putative inactive cadmium/zinc-transporting ATPase HMA3 [Mangifera indica]
MSAQGKDMAAKNLQKSYFDVLGLCCSSEVPLVENILKSLDGVKEVSVVVPTKTVIVVHDSLIISQLQIVKALNRARLEAHVRACGGKNYKKKWPSPYAVACGILLALSFFQYLCHPFRWMAVGAVAVGICPIILKGFAALRNLRLDVNILMLIAVIGTIAMNDYTEAGTIVFLFTIAEWLEARASHKATAVMSQLTSIAPRKAVIAETGEEVDAGEVKLNTVVAVKAGEIIPIDGIVVDGTCEVDEKTLTGESFPVAKQKDSSVWAGTINQNGYINVKTTALAEDCVVAKMAKLVEEAQNGKTKAQRIIDKCAQYYTPAVIILSACVAVIPAALRVRNRSHWFQLALVVLVSACPCALILSTPVATFCALTKAATAGLLFKRVDYLEVLAKVKVMAFDKTGTITKGEFVVSEFQSLSEDINSNTLMQWVSSIESKSSHPMAAALVDYGRSLSLEPKPESVEDYHNFPGEGIYGRIDGEELYIGNRKIAPRAGCETVPSVEGVNKEGKTIGYIYFRASLVGIFSLSDACRTGAAEAVKELNSMGIKTALLTGDNEASAMQAQQQLGNSLEAVHSELLPEDKVKIIKEFKNEGPTAMVGDGVNDAPALATADIGISMGISGSALATETGHVILMSNDIRKVPAAIKLARKAHLKVIQNVIMSMSTKAAILVLAIVGHPLVWAAVLADVGTCLLVILNSMLILKGTQTHGGEGCKSSAKSVHHKHGGKCCESSAQSDNHKHGGNYCKSSHLLHNHKQGGKCCKSSEESQSTYKYNQQQCCNSNKSQKACKPKQSPCCSSNSCGSINQCKVPAKKQNVYRGSDATHNTRKHCDSANCGNKDHDLEAQNSHIHGCSLVETQDKPVEDHCQHGHCDNESHKHNHCHLDHTCTEEDRIIASHGHCHTVQCSENDVTNHIGNESGKAVESICGHGLHRRVCCNTTADNALGTVAMSSCISLEKREISASCKSDYMKQCCAKHGHLGAGLGGLTEVVTE